MKTMASSDVIENLPENLVKIEDKLMKPVEEKVPEDLAKWRKAKKHAVLVSFVGKDYLGMQR